MGNPVTKSFPRAFAVLMTPSGHGGEPPYRATFRWTDTKTGEGMKGWRKVIRDGGNATTPFTGSQGEMRIENGSMSLVHSHDFAPGVMNSDAAFGHTTNGRLVAPDSLNSFTTGFDTSADNAARGYLYKRIRQEYTKIQGGVFVAELHKTVRMIASPLKNFRNGLDSYVAGARKYFRGTRDKLPERKKFLAKSWLEYVYGWQPMLHDVQDGLEAYWALAHQELHNRISATGKNEVIRNQVSMLTQPVTHIFQDESWRDVEQCTVRYTAGLKHSLEGMPTENERVRALFGFNLREFVPTVWELIPYSFLVDYFTNIGDILNAAVTDTSKVTWICRTVRKTVTRTGTAQSNMKQIQANIGGSLGHIHGFSYKPSNVTIQWKTVSRGVGVLSIPSLEFQVPGETSTRWLNIAALAGQRRI